MKNYIISLIVLFIVFFIYCHIKRFSDVNNNLNIIQVVDPDPEKVYDLISQGQPIVFQSEIKLWKNFNTLIGKSLTNIKASITLDSNKYTNTIKQNLEPINIPLSYDWNIDLRHVILDNTAAIFMIKQRNLMQVIGCVTGEFRIIISPPDQYTHFGEFINNVGNKDITKELDNDPPTINFIEIIVRQGNLIYIPFNWHYFIYRSNSNTETVIIDCINKSILTYFENILY